MPRTTTPQPKYPPIRAYFNQLATRTQAMPRPITYSHLNIETEGVIDSPDSDSFHVFVREDHPILLTLVNIPHAIERVRSTLYHPHTHDPKKPHHAWYRVRRGVFYHTTNYLHRIYDIDEHLALHYHYEPAVTTAPQSRRGSLDPGHSRRNSANSV